MTEKFVVTGHDLRRLRRPCGKGGQLAGRRGQRRREPDAGDAGVLLRCGQGLAAGHHHRRGGGGLRSRPGGRRQARYPPGAGGIRQGHGPPSPVVGGVPCAPVLPQHGPHDGPAGAGLHAPPAPAGRRWCSWRCACPSSSSTAPTSPWASPACSRAAPTWTRWWRWARRRDWCTVSSKWVCWPPDRSPAMPDLYFESAGMILALVTVGKYLEERSKGKTTRRHHGAAGAGPGCGGGAPQRHGGHGSHRPDQGRRDGDRPAGRPHPRGTAPSPGAAAPWTNPPSPARVCPWKRSPQQGRVRHRPHRAAIWR